MLGDFLSNPCPGHLVLVGLAVLHLLYRPRLNASWLNVSFRLLQSGPCWWFKQQMPEPDAQLLRVQTGCLALKSSSGLTDVTVHVEFENLLCEASLYGSPAATFRTSSHGCHLDPVDPIKRERSNRASACHLTSPSGPVRGRKPHKRRRRRTGGVAIALHPPELIEKASKTESLAAIIVFREVSLSGCQTTLELPTPNVEGRSSFSCH